MEIRVEDTGIGIQPELLPHVFMRFWQADGSTTRKFGGLGLGLSIVKHIVDLHGGSVWAESAGQDRGSTFHVQLPLIGAAAQHMHQNEDERGLTLEGVRVLLVDDDKDGRDVLRRVLEDYGASVSTAEDARSALHELTRNRVDVLVSDIGMPEMDGYELMRRVRQLPRHENGRVPSIALTAFARGDDRTRALDAGFHCHISKPFEPVIAARAIADLCRDGHVPS